MNGQLTFAQLEPTGEASVAFLAGFITTAAFGDKPTAEQRRRGRKLAEETGSRIAELKANP